MKKLMATVAFFLAAMSAAHAVEVGQIVTVQPKTLDGLARPAAACINPAYADRLTSFPYVWQIVDFVQQHSSSCTFLNEPGNNQWRVVKKVPSNRLWRGYRQAWFCLESTIDLRIDPSEPADPIPCFWTHTVDQR